MTERKAITRSELADDETATVLTEALAGRRLSRGAARQLATSLRRVTGALPAGTGNLAGLSRRLASAADVLDAQAAAPTRGDARRAAIRPLPSDHDDQSP